MMEMCVPNMCCESLEIGYISFGCLLLKKKSIVDLDYVYFGSMYGWSSKFYSNNCVYFSIFKRFLYVYFIKYFCKLSNDGRNWWI